LSFFIDANVVLYTAKGDSRGRACREILAAVARREADGRSSVMALEEVWHLELSGRIPGIAGLARRAYDALEPLLAVSDEAFRLALELPAKRLGANDRLHAGTCLANGIETIVSADAGFDELERPRRVDPLDSERLGALLGS